MLLFFNEMWLLQMGQFILCLDRVVQGNLRICLDFFSSIFWCCLKHWKFRIKSLYIYAKWLKQMIFYFTLYSKMVSSYVLNTLMETLILDNLAQVIKFELQIKLFWSLVFSNIAQSCNFFILKTKSKTVTWYYLL